jgi:hypothetical protein
MKPLPIPPRTCPLCLEEFKPKKFNVMYCDTCRAKYNSTERWRLVNREHHLKQHLEHEKRRKERDVEAYLAQNRKHGSLWRQRHPTQHAMNCRKYWTLLRDQAIQAYGGWMCVCCGETTPEFLTIDHINGRSEEEKRNPKLKRSGGKLYVWLRQNNYPPGFQVMCQNCNFGKGHFGSCPHTWDRSKGASNQGKLSFSFTGPVVQPN